MPETARSCDVVIIGSGAGGGTMAAALASTGADIIILERGRRVPREPENWSAEEVFRRERYVSPETWETPSGHMHPQSHYWVGGATKFYGAALYRLRPGDFGESAHASGVSPAWPVTYADMEPFYSAAERMYSVHGQHGEDPTEGPWSHEYPFPAIPHEPVIQALADKLTARGLHPFHSPNAVRATTGECVLCPACDGHPCPLRAKADAEVVGVDRALGHSSVSLMTEARVIRIATVGGLAAAVEYVAADGSLDTILCQHVVLAAGAVNSALILLRSGLGGPLVGRNYMAHVSRALIAVGPDPNPTRFQKTLGVNDWYGPDNPASPWPLGNVQMLGKSTGDAMKSEGGMASMFPQRFLNRVASHSVDLWLTTEDLPSVDNGVRLTDAGTAQFRRQPSSLVPSRLLEQAVRHALGRRFLFRSMLMGDEAVAHQAGTCRMGTAPGNSVVGPQCRLWDCPNVIVADASVFPSVGAVNPALTVMANSLRIAARLRTELGGT